MNPAFEFPDPSGDYSHDLTAGRAAAHEQRKACSVTFRADGSDTAKLAWTYADIAGDTIAMLGGVPDDELLAALEAVEDVARWVHRCISADTREDKP